MNRNDEVPHFGEFFITHLSLLITYQYHFLSLITSPSPLPSPSYFFLPNYQKLVVVLRWQIRLDLLPTLGTPVHITMRRCRSYYLYCRVMRLFERQTPNLTVGRTHLFFIRPSSVLSVGSHKTENNGDFSVLVNNR